MKTKVGHSYLIGEPVNYDGPSALECVRNFESLITDLCVEAEIKIPSEVFDRMHYYIQKFVNSFFNRMDQLKGQSGHDVENFATQCKERRNDLLAVCTGIATNELYRMPETLFIQVGDDKVIPCISINYLPSRSRAVLSIHPEFGVMEYFQLQHQPHWYIYLYGLLFWILELMGSEERSKEISRTLILLPCSLGQLYEKLNPSSDVMDDYASKLYDMLQAPSNELPEDFVQLFNSVAEDIKKGKLPYIKDISKVIRDHSQDLENWKFNKSDYYVTLKSTSSRLKREGRPDRHFPSIVASLIETDPLIGEPIVDSFDAYVGYKSPYTNVGSITLNGEEYEVETMTVKTVEIPNPSKYKPRGIHIGSNAVQDRCNLIHHKLQPLLKDLKCDSHKDHMKGVRFLQHVTKPETREAEHNNVFVSDFSNATDTLNQEFQCMCLGIIFPQIIVDFWMFISRAPKYFFFKEKYNYYSQETGQPQGLLGSFDAFSWAHHILMLMLMKASGFTNIESDRFYTILGDDSVVSYPSQISVSTNAVYKKHTELCIAANLDKNDSKTGKSFFEDDPEGDFLDYDDSTVLDFAKVSIYRGKLCTPLPVTLALTYQDNKKEKRSRFTAPLWFAAHEVYFKRWMNHLIIQNYKDDWFGLMVAITITTSGEIPYLKGFKDEELSSKIPEVIKGLSIFGYGFTEFRNSVFGYFVSDQTRKESIKESVSFEHLWKNLFREDVEELLNHQAKGGKFWELISEYSEFGEELQALYELEDRDLAKCISALAGNLELQDTIDHLYKRYDSFMSHLQNDDSLLFTDLYDLHYQDLFSDNKKIGSLQVRSLREKASNYSLYLTSTIRWLKQELRISPKIYNTRSEEISGEIVEVLSLISSYADGRLYYYSTLR